jgi:hypothetical protein
MALARHMDMVNAEFARRFRGFHTKDTRPMPLYVFRQREDYERFIRKQGLNAANTGGVFFYTDKGSGLAVWISGQSSQQIIQLMQHEGFHQFAWVRIGRDLPSWANEGLAEYFADAFLLRGSFVTGKTNARRVRRVKAAAQDSSYVPFRRLLNMTTDEWLSKVNGGDRRAGLLYDQAWSIVHFLIHGGNGKYAGPFENYLKLISRGTLPNKAFKRAFRTDDYGSFENAWKKYVAQLEPDPIYIAAERLEFLGLGLKYLFEHDIEIHTIGELRTALKASNFRMMRNSHGEVETVSAADDDLFEPPQPAEDAGAATLELVPSERDDKPPSLWIKGLSPDVGLVWRLDSEGALRDELVFQ